MDITQKSGIFNMDDVNTPLRYRYRGGKNVSSNNNISTSEPSSPPALPHIRLKRELAQYKWSHGINIFNKLYNEYKVYMLFICLSPIYTLSYNVSIIQYFTRHEFYWYGLCVPLLIPLVLYVFCKWYLFKTSNSISTTKFSYYPGIGYDYGVIITNIYDQENESHLRYQYWVAHNSYTKEMDCICVIDEEYDIPENHNHIEFSFE